MALPDSVHTNAWSPKLARAVRGRLHAAARKWVADQPRSEVDAALVDREADLAKWRDRRVGWGLILPMPPQDKHYSAGALARAEDQIEPIQKLVRDREAPVFRYLGGPRRNRELL